MVIQEINVIKGLKRNKVNMAAYIRKKHLSHNYFHSSNNYTQEKIITICNDTGVSLFDVCEDSRFQKYYNDKGELIKIEKI